MNLNAIQILSGLGGPPLWKVSLLASLPLLTNGISSYFLVPLSISIGRRPVILVCGIMAWIGGFWAGCSSSLDSHIAARCFQAVGAGAVEALIPLIVQDVVFIHERNRATSAIWAAQGLLIVSLGVAAPAVVATVGWRWLYFVAAWLALAAWAAVAAFLPETRWARSAAELAGKDVYALRGGDTRPAIDTRLPPRTLWTDVGLFTLGFAHRDALRSVRDTLRTMLFPNVLWAVAVNAALISVFNAAGQTASAVLIAAGWKFKVLGLALLPVVVATPLVWLLGGYVADEVSNGIARRNGGRREPEVHLLNLVAPLVMGVLGCVLFGYAAENVATASWFVFLMGIFFIALGFMVANTVMSVYVVESYPQWAG